MCNVFSSRSYIFCLLSQLSHSVWCKLRKNQPKKSFPCAILSCRLNYSQKWVLSYHLAFLFTALLPEYIQIPAFPTSSPPVFEHKGLQAESMTTIYSNTASIISKSQQTARLRDQSTTLQHLLRWETARENKWKLLFNIVLQLSQASWLVERKTLRETYNN